MSFPIPKVIAIWFAAAVLPILVQAITPREEFAAALAHFKTEGPPGWSYIQVSTGEGKNEIEAYNPLQFPPLCWTLLEKDYKKPSDADQMDYHNLKAQRSSEFNAPRIETEIDLRTCHVLEDTPTLLKAAFRLKVNADTQEAAKHLEVEVTLSRPSGTIEQVEILNRAPFSPFFFVRIDRMHTVLQYSLPHGDTPSLLMHISVSIRGKLFWLKTLDQQLEIVRKHYRYAGKKPVA